ncbi:MFS transporter [Paenibacillus sp. OSY-SE]|uniref:MFS transporter n=1 Tax=Paenibacillus sp. OSY-SE TaxID=1196323 RepID=UPI0003112B10|nr:MFS transporter [Paenibacillus sp. OSY-SE]
MSASPALPLWRNRVFLVVTTADVLQELGIWIRNIAILFYVMEMTNHNPVAVSLITVFEYLPIFLFSFIGGTLADRWNPKRTVITGDILSALSIGLILICMQSGIWQSVFVATVVSAMVSQFSRPSSTVLFKRHVPEAQVPAAIGIGQSLSSLFLIVGPIIGTFVYQTFHVETSLTVLMFIFLLAAAIQFSLPHSPRKPKDEPSRIIGEMKDGLRYVIQHANLRNIALMYGLISLGVGLIQPMEVFLITQRLGLEKEQLQWFTTVAGVGLFAGVGIAALMGNAVRRHGRAIMCFVILILSAATLFEVWSTFAWLTGSLRFLVGFIMAFFQVVISTFFITLVTDEYIGRVNGIITPIFTAGILIGSSVSGFLMQYTSLFAVFACSALLIALSVLFCFQLELHPSESQNAQLESAGV